jgi:hypothetical protein
MYLPTVQGHLNLRLSPHSLQSSETIVSNSAAGFCSCSDLCLKRARERLQAGHGPNIERRLTMERVPVEIWQQILLKVMEMDDEHIFATSCTPYTFLYFVNQHTHIHNHRKSHLGYLERRRRLRLVCRAWSEFVLLTKHRWLQLGEASAVDYLTSTTPDAGGVRAVERLSTTIGPVEWVTPTLSWTSHILKRPANQSPLRVFTLRLLISPPRGHNLFDYFVGTGTTPECTSANTNTTLRSLSITTPINSNASIPLSQISSTFKGLRSLFLIDFIAAPTQAIALPHLEVLYMQHTFSAFPTLKQPMQTWDTPALRHVYLGYFDDARRLTAVLDGFLGRYARQIESLVLLERSQSLPSIVNLPPGFWSQFSALRLLGLQVSTLEREDWSGWTVVPPATHPLRYLVCWSMRPTTNTVDRVCPRWTWHGGVRLVVEQRFTDTYHVVKDVRDDQWITEMEKTYGILPEL